MNNILNFTTSDFEEHLFPELKQLDKIRNKIKLYKKSTVEELSDFFCIRHEIVRHSKIVEESIFVKKESLPALNEVINDIKKVRKEKQVKKLSNYSLIIKSKESKFNKIYDDSGLPIDLRKKCYNHFVLNKNSYEKDIKLKKIKRFIENKDEFHFKKQVKELKKILKDMLIDDEHLIITDYGIKYKTSIYIELLNHEFSRDIDIISFNDSDFFSKSNDFKHNSSNTIYDLVQERLEVSKLNEKERINKAINYINSNINIKNIEQNILLKTLKASINKYNKEDILSHFTLKLFTNYSNNCEYFSKMQNKVFLTRSKFRNRMPITIYGFEFETCFFLKYKNIKNNFTNLFSSSVSIDIFHNWIKTTNETLVKNQLKKSFTQINEELDRQYAEVLLNNKEHEDILSRSLLKDDLKNLVLENLARTPENRRNEINKNRICEIFKGEQKEILELVRKSLIQQLINIDYKKSFSIARKYKRKFKFYVGKTNSGKTYSAFNDLVSHNSGIYLSPLRLLALEGQEELQSRGVKCSMITGEERNYEKGSNFTSSTIEMLDTTKEVDCIVIDEIQMLKDENRGWAWTQAVIGAPAKNIILTGSDEVLSLIEELIKYTDDELEIERLERKSPLKVLKNTVDIKNIKDSTVIVAFSRKDVLMYKSLLKNKKVSIIYGNLGSDVRQEEARKFRSGETTILVATDAIAMGLNLPIETVLFSTHTKNIKRETIELDEQLLQQIAGRAGRYGLKNVGYVGALNPKTLKYVTEIMSHEIPKYYGKATIMPNLNYLIQIQENLGIKDFKDILISFGKYAAFDSDNFLCTDLQKMIELSNEIEKYNLSTEENLRLVSAPVRENYDDGLFYYNKYVSKIVENSELPSEYRKEVLSPNINKFKNKTSTKDVMFLKKAEEALHNIDLYNWFNLHYSDIFSDLEGVNKKRKTINNFIINSLQEINVANSKNRNKKSSR